MSPFPEPPFRKIAAAIRKLLDDGAYSPGDPLPSASTLAREHGVHRDVVQHAIDLLRAEGRIETRRGAPAIVRRVEQPRPRRRLSRNRYASARARGGKLTRGLRRSEITYAGAREAPERVAAIYGLPAGTPMVLRERIFYDERSKPCELSESWLRLDEFGDTALMLPADLPRGLFLTAEQLGGRGYAIGRDIVTARLATPEEARRLCAPAPVPVLDLLHVAMDADRSPIEVVLSVYPGDTVVLDDEYDISQAATPDDLSEV